MMLSYSDKYVAAALLGSLLFGYHVAVLNPSIKHFTIAYGTCKGQADPINCPDARFYESTTSAIVFLGAMIGCLMAGYAVAIGRRLALIVTHVTSIVAALLCFFASSFPLLLLGRAVAGLCVGMTCVACPSFISEICQARSRGSRGTLHQMAITLAILLAVSLGLCLTPVAQLPTFDDLPSFEYQFIFLQQLLPGVISLIYIMMAMFVLKDDTPHSYLLRGNTAAASTVLSKIYANDPQAADDRLHELMGEIGSADGRSNNKKGSSLFQAMRRKPGYMRCVVIGCLVAMGQQVGGINAFMARSTQIFEEGGIAANLTAKMSVIVTLVNVFMTIPSIFIVDRLGRKPLLAVGCLGQALVLSVVPLYKLMGKDTATACVIAVIGYIVFFALGYGPVCWVYLFEMFPADIKGSASSLASSINWVVGFVIVLLSGVMRDYTVTSFAMYAVLCYMTFVFVIFQVKETKGCTTSPYIKDASFDEDVPLIMSP